MLPSDDAVLKHLGEAVFTAGNDGQIVSSNAAATKLTGYTDKELKTLSLANLSGPEPDAIKLQYELNQAIQRNGFFIEGWGFRKDASRYWAETSYWPIFDEKDRHWGFSVLIKDITQKKQEQIALLESEERYRLIVEAVRDYSIFMLDTQGHIVTWNDGGRLVHGYSAPEVLGRYFSFFYTHDDLLAKKPETELEVAKTTGTYREEGWRVRKDGSLFWASVVLTALYDAHNKHIGYSKVVRDLTDKMMAEESLRQSEIRYRSLVEQVGDYGIFMLDTKGRIVSWNEGAKRIKGYAAEEIIGKYFSVFYPEEEIIGGKPVRELQIARASGKYEEEGWRLRKDGSRFWANIVITALYDPEGRHTGFSKVTRDLTERKLAEQALQQSSNQYRQLAAELSESNDRLSVVNRELEEFTAVVSHDLKEPVRTIKSHLLLMKQNLQQENFETIPISLAKSLRGVQRMQELIDNLLYYSQISNVNLQKQKLKASDVIAEAVQNLDDAIQKSGAELIINQQVDYLYGDRVQLVQLLQNLLSNAIKFTEKEKPEVIISAFSQDEHIELVVQDNGIGIPNEHLEKVFGVFRRLHFASKYPGNGVGLAICKKVVERHNGRIWVESKPGQGTSFHVILPQGWPATTQENEAV